MILLVLVLIVFSLFINIRAVFSPASTFSSDKESSSLKPVRELNLVVAVQGDPVLLLLSILGVGKWSVRRDVRVKSDVVASFHGVPQII